MIAEQYLEKIKDIWNLDTKAYLGLKRNLEAIERAFKGYDWENVSWAIDTFYTRKNDKTYPRISQILAILTAHGIKPFVEDNNVQEYKSPWTGIRAISGVINDVAKAMHTNGICFIPYFEKVENIPFGNKNYIKNGELHNKQWDWDDGVQVAKQNYPQEFAKYRNMNKLEEYALTYKLGCLKI